jgi:hypothetical protein
VQPKHTFDPTPIEASKGDTREPQACRLHEGAIRHDRDLPKAGLGGR